MKGACELYIKDLYLTPGDQNRPQIIKIPPKSYSLVPKTFMKIHFWYFGEKIRLALASILFIGLWHYSYSKITVFTRNDCPPGRD